MTNMNRETSRRFGRTDISVLSIIQIGGSLNTAPEMGRALGTDVPGEWAWIPAS